MTKDATASDGLEMKSISLRLPAAIKDAVAGLGLAGERSTNETIVRILVQSIWTGRDDVATRLEEAQAEMNVWSNVLKKASENPALGVLLDDFPEGSKEYDALESFIDSFTLNDDSAEFGDVARWATVLAGGVGRLSKSLAAIDRYMELSADTAPKDDKRGPLLRVIEGDKEE